MDLLKKVDEKSSYLDDLLRIENVTNTPKVQYKGFWSYSDVLKSLPFIETKYKSLPSDVLISSFPKSGTTWLKALVYAILHVNTSNDLLQTHNPHQLVPFFECGTFGENPTSNIDEIPSPRIFNTHMPYSFLPKNVIDNSSSCKIIHISRNPADIIVSWWHFREKAYGDRKKLEEVFDEFIKGTALFGPLLEFVLEYWEAREKENMLFITYEGLKKNPSANVKKIADYLGCALRDNEIETIVTKTSFERLSKLDVNTLEENKVIVPVWPRGRIMPASSFFRNGSVGDGKNCLTVEMIEKLNASIDRVWGGSGLELLDREP